MAFTPYPYQPNYFGPSPYAVPPQAQPMPQAPAPQQRGFVRVQNEQEARTYPVAPGNSVTFIDENAPYCYTKTMDFSQLDRPKFERYRLVKEEDEPTPAASEPAPVTRQEFDELASKVAHLMASMPTKSEEVAVNE